MVVGFHTPYVCYTQSIMASYTLIQDIEAEDKILGPLTLRQFIFALVAAFLFYICFILVTRHFAFMLVVFLPPALFCAFFAFPFGRDQPTEVWALAKLRFYFKPRRRVWNQTGVKELVTITVPKKVERVLTNGLSQTEVKSRLRALADTIDSRGWAIKNIDAQLYAQPMANGSSDRLIDIGNLPHEVPSSELVAADDIMDEANNPIARQFETMIDQSTRTHRRQLINQLNGIREDVNTVRPTSNGADGSGKWFMNVNRSAGMPAMAAPAAVATGFTAPITTGQDEAALSASLAARTDSRQVSFGNLRTVQPLGSPSAAQTTDATATMPATGYTSAAVGQVDDQTATTPPTDTVTATTDPDILSLAKNDDLNVATLAREARKKQGENSSRDEVVISLH